MTGTEERQTCLRAKGAESYVLHTLPQFSQRISWHGDKDYRLNLELAVCTENAVLQ